MSSAMNRVAAAPVSWGVFESTSAVPVESYLDDVAQAGYGGTELGPAGYLGPPTVVKSELSARGLALVGAFLPLPFTKPEERTASRSEAGALMDLLEAACPDGDLPTILLSDAYQQPARIAAAGRVDETPEVWLEDAAWDVLVAQVHEVASACRDRGFDVAFHPHGGSYVEAPFEVDRLMGAIDRELIGLCLDTGHSYFGGDDPLRLIRDHGDAISWVHLKDVDVDVLSELKKEGFGLEEAWRRGVFCELGQGGVTIDPILTALARANYDSWIVVEQDRLLGGLPELPHAGEDARRNRAFLRARGL